ncbi:hypothetical protein MKC39_06870, partial [[Clostridium] innocuum]|nr:hypothetical protein [[Clostridium] innocuum]MCR0311150.1 hypothetical protein [[Clostridium] innocuum]MCR0325508.1 hypothetical protein [[Clostridium] innocuum]MCR0354830.1 hypothetical protein [[Clostridium] innocuum]MCR0398843.1 hypothetical protein [[Clostridium] innocuum]
RKKGLKPDSLKKLFSVYPKYKNHNKKGCDFQRNTNFSYSSQPLLKAMLIHDRVGYILMGKNQQEHREFALLISYCFLMNTLQGLRIRK